MQVATIMQKGLKVEFLSKESLVPRLFVWREEEERAPLHYWGDGKLHAIILTKWVWQWVWQYYCIATSIRVLESTCRSMAAININVHRKI